MLGTADGRIDLRAKGYTVCAWHVVCCVGELWHIESSSSSNVLNSGRKQQVFTGITEATSL